MNVAAFTGRRLSQPPHSRRVCPESSQAEWLDWRSWPPFAGSGDPCGPVQRSILGPETRVQGPEPKIFEDVLEFARVVPLYDVQITVLTAFPGTPLYDRRMREGPILESGRWDLCTLFDVNYRPEGMSPEHLKEGMYCLTERLYSDECTQYRRQGFFAQMRHHHRTHAHDLVGAC